VKFWIDAHLSPSLAVWLRTEFGVEAVALDDLGLRQANDIDVFRRATSPGLVIMSKDEDFEQILRRHGPPPQILWVRCGNTTNEALMALLRGTFPDAMRLLAAGEPIVEIGETRPRVQS
jgi:predicted nuclease of predicted toxin-antitoxin system